MAETSQENKKTKLRVKSWYSNRYQIVVVQRNILLLFTLVSMFSVAVAVIFVKNIMSSKSLEPYVIEVEEKTGIATVVDQLTAQTFTGDQMIRKYFINEFVHAATGYDPKTYKQDLEKEIASALSHNTNQTHIPVAVPVSRGGRKRHTKSFRMKKLNNTKKRHQ
jgi:type IV secretion system protein VirB8